jgi:hypothetical protein
VSAEHPEGDVPALKIPDEEIHYEVHGSVIR